MHHKREREALTGTIADDGNYYTPFLTANSQQTPQAIYVCAHSISEYCLAAQLSMLIQQLQMARELSGLCFYPETWQARVCKARD